MCGLIDYYETVCLTILLMRKGFEKKYFIVLWLGTRNHEKKKKKKLSDGEKLP